MSDEIKRKRKKEKNRAINTPGIGPVSNNIRHGATRRPLFASNKIRPDRVLRSENLKGGSHPLSTGALSGSIRDCSMAYDEGCSSKCRGSRWQIVCSEQRYAYERVND